MSGADGTELDETAVAAVAKLLTQVESALFITGAGISADSGLPTYRGIGGLYEDADTDEGVPIEVALSGQMMRAHPQLCWKYIRRIEEACRGASHNAAHEIIARFEHRLERVWVLTQNVDGFHRHAGSDNVIAIHGDIHDLHCTACDYRTEVDDYAEVDPVPTCPKCGSVVRPDVVLFGEMLPSPAVAALDRELQRGFDVVFSVGTSSAFPYIARPVIDARVRGIPTVEINPGATELSEIVEHRIAARARPAFEALWSVFESRTG